MKKHITGVILVAVILVGAIGAFLLVNQGSEKPQGFTVTDALGRTVTIPDDPEMFVAIGPGCLRLYCYVGDTNKLVGIEHIEITWADYAGRPYMLANQNLLQLPVIGEGGPNATPDSEKLVAVDPDVIFTMYNWDASQVNELQEKTKIPVVALSYGESDVFDEAVYHSLELIGKITDRQDRAQEVINYFKAIQVDLANRTKDIPDNEKPTVNLVALNMYATKGIQSTTANYSLFNAVNARNIIDEDSEKSGITGYAYIDKEYLLDLNPDIIILDAAGLSLVQADYEKFPEYYNGLSAFKNGNIYVQLPYNNYYTNIEIALANAYYIGSVLYPDRFADINVGDKFNQITTELLGASLYTDVAGAYFGGYQKISFG